MKRHHLSAMFEPIVLTTIWTLQEWDDVTFYPIAHFSTKALAEAYLETFPKWDRSLNEIHIQPRQVDLSSLINEPWFKIDQPLIPWGTVGFILKRKEAYEGEEELESWNPLWDFELVRPAPSMLDNPPQWNVINGDSDFFLVFTHCYAENPGKAIEKMKTYRKEAIAAGTYPKRERHA